MLEQEHESITLHHCTFGQSLSFAENSVVLLLLLLLFHCLICVRIHGMGRVRGGRWSQHSQPLQRLYRSSQTQRSWDTATPPVARDPPFFVHHWPKHQLVSCALYIHPHITHQPPRSLSTVTSTAASQQPLHPPPPTHPPAEHHVLIPNDTHRHQNHIYPNPSIKIALSCQSRDGKIFRMVKEREGGGRSGDELPRGSFRMHLLPEFDPFPWHASIYISKRYGGQSVSWQLGKQLRRKSHSWRG